MQNYTDSTMHLIISIQFDRYLEQNMIQVAILPSNPKKESLPRFLAPLIEELKKLETDSMHIIGSDGVELFVKGSSILVSGDIIGITDIYCHAGHMLKFSCRICPIEIMSLLSPKKKRYGQHFVGSDTLLKKRSVDDYKIGNTVRIFFKKYINK